MDNFTGLFGDGDLEHLDLGADSFRPLEDPAASYTTASGPSILPAQNSGQIPQQKITMMTHQLATPTQQSVVGYQNAPSGYQYVTRISEPQPIVQYSGDQYQHAYQRQEIYSERQPVQVNNQNISSWGAQPPQYSQLPGNYQQPQTTYTVSNSQQAINYQNQALAGTTNMNNMQPTYQTMNQGYAPDSQVVAYQVSQGPSYSTYDLQRTNPPTNANTFQGSQPQQYTIIQNHPQQTYHISQQYQTHVPIAQMHPVSAQPMISGMQAQSEISQYPNTQIPNGSPVYRAHYSQASPQLSPHPQASPLPQLSPMTRSVSPHPCPTSSIASPVSSSSASLAPSGASPAAGAGSHLENLGPGRNTPVNPIQAPMHSPVMYSNNINTNINSPLAPISPGLVSRPNTSSPLNHRIVGSRPSLPQQQWQQNSPVNHPTYVQPNNYNQMIVNVQRVPAPSSLPHHSGSSIVILNSDSIVSVSDAMLNPIGSAISLSNGPETNSGNLNSSTIAVSLESEIQNVTSSNIPESRNTPSDSYGPLIHSDNMHGQSSLPLNVPPSSVLPAGTQISMVSPAVSQVTLSGNVPPQPTTHQVTSTSLRVENGSQIISSSLKGMPTSVCTGNSLSGAPQPANSSGNTIIRYAGPVGPTPQQHYRDIGPKLFVPQAQVESGTDQKKTVTQILHPNMEIVTAPSVDSGSATKFSAVTQASKSKGNIQAAQNPLPSETMTKPSNFLLDKTSDDSSKEDSGSSVPGPISLSDHMATSADHLIRSNDTPSAEPATFQSSTVTNTATISTSKTGQMGPISLTLSGAPVVTQVTSVSMCNAPPSNTAQTTIIVATGPIVTNTAGGTIAMVTHPGGMINTADPTMIGRPSVAPGEQPTVRGMVVGQGPPMQPQLNIANDIQHCQQQIQHLCKMQQNVQTQQQIDDLKQRLNQLQQQHFIHNPALYCSPTTQPGPETPDKTETKKRIRDKPRKASRAKRDPKPRKETKPKKETKSRITKSPKVPKEPKPKEPKPAREPKPKKERIPKPPRPPKPRREKKSSNKKTRKTLQPLLPKFDIDGKPLPVDTGTGAPPAALMDPTFSPLTLTKVDPMTELQPKADKKKGKYSKKKLSAKLKFLQNLKKRKRKGSESDFSESEGGISVIRKGTEDASVPRVVAEEDEANKRRSGRFLGSRKKYVDELDLNLSEEDPTQNPPTEAEMMEDDGDPTLIKPNFMYLDPNTEDTMAVQMILGIRVGEREVLSEPEDENATGEGKVMEKRPPQKVDVDEFYVKYKAFSYLHCEWRTEEELMKGDKRIHGKVKRFKQKRAASQNIMDFLEEEAFNPEYTEIDRILDVTDSNDPDTDDKGSKHYLVKWKSLPYEDSTWEIEDDCDLEKIRLFLLYRDLPSKAVIRYRKRPKPEEWKKLEDSTFYKNNNKLREYQLEGLNWLNFSFYNGHHCILADEMGLGKTIQSLAFIEACVKYGIRGPYLIIAPLSTIPNWQREFEGWTDLNVIVYHGSQTSRNMILEYDMYYKDENGERIPNIFKFHVLITTFEIIISDTADLREINWRVCIIDEAHRLKNRNCKLLEGLRLMHLEHRVLLSGTPLQNNVNELFSLLNFLEPAQFSCQEEFLAEFGKLETEEQVKKLQALLKPMMLRRMKEDVEKALAPKEETIIEVELTNIQKKYYRAILERNFDFLIKGATYNNVPSLMNTMMELRKCCLHPFLLKGAEDGIQEDYRQTHNKEKVDVYLSALVQSSGKMVLVDKLLPRLKENGHRVLVFSQMVKLLDLLEDYLINKKYPYERLDGRIRGNLRQAAIDRFCKPDSDRFVFLLCTKAGGLGINLTAADTVIIYDSDWNPQNDLQAQARCHRIGQEKCVKIYRLLCRNTYEREMFDRASLKLGLDKAVLQSLNTEVKTAAGGNSLGLSKKDIEDLLKKGAYGALMEDDNQGDKFCEEDIDQIMSRRTTVITLESEKGSTFSKASFLASNTRDDIDLDDPDFWKKWAKKADMEMEDGETLRRKQLIMDEPRRRSQIRRYGHDESVVDCSDLDSSGSDSGDQDQSEDVTGDHRLRSRRGRRRTRGTRNVRGRNTRISSRWAAEEELLDTGDVRYGFWHRSECFKVEKGLLTFGWGRWKEILQNGEFRAAWKLCDVEECARMVLLFCIRYYRGDDKIKGFIFDLIAPTVDGKQRMHHNHIGLSAPVPRGRKGKKKLREAKLIASHMECADWAKDDKFDTDLYLDQGYSRHLTRHANKVLLRVRLLFYIKQEIISDFALQIEEGCRASDLPIHPPPTELPPKPWWDVESDRSLLAGVYKHGYDRYNVMRNDPCLCFLHRCGPPDKAALLLEMSSNVNEDEMEKDDKEDIEKEDSDSNQTSPNSPAISCSTNKSDDDRRDMTLPFPSSSDINGRLRRLVTSYQRNNKKLEMRKEANVRGFDHYLADKLMRRERMAEYIRDRELRKTDYNQRRWSNREQAEFYRTISTFGVEYIRKEKRYDWSKFRMLSRLEKRIDENLTEYFRAFMAMCKRQCGIRLSDQENAKIIEVGVDRLPEERARRVLERVDLLNRLRNDVLPHPDLHKALFGLALPSRDLPDWWIPGQHDFDLIRGVARHGLGRTDYYILYDPDLCFREILRRHTAGEPLITKKEQEEKRKRFYNEEEEATENESKGEAKENKEEDLEERESKDNDEEEKAENLSNKEIKETNDEGTSEGKDDVTHGNTDDEGNGKAGNEEHVCDEVDNEKKEEVMISSKEVTEEKGDENEGSLTEPEASDAIGNEEVKKCSSKEATDERNSGNEEKSDDCEMKDKEDVNILHSREVSKVENVKEEKVEVKRETEENPVATEGSELLIKKEELKDHENIVKKEEPKVKEENEEGTTEPKKEVKEEMKEIIKMKAEIKDSKAIPIITPLLSLQQMDEAMAKIDSNVCIDSLAATEPTVAQLLAQSAANPIKWPKDRVLQTRLEHIMYAVEHQRWPVPIDFISNDQDFLVGGVKCDTPPSAPSTPTGHTAYELLMLEADRKRRRQMEAEVERAHLQAMLHPNLHHNLGLAKLTSHSAEVAATAAAAAALGINPNSFNAASLRSFFELNDPEKKMLHQQQLVNDAHANALRQLQALQGSLDLTIKPVSSCQSLDLSTNYLGRRGPGRPRLDESGDKRRQCDSPQDKGPQKRRKLDEIVLGLTSKGKSQDFVGINTNPLSLLKGSSVTLLSNRDMLQVTPSITTPKLSSSISITPTNLTKIAKGEPNLNKVPSSDEDKPGLIKTSDLPPGISLPPGIELYRPSDANKVDKWLEQHQDLLTDSFKSPKDAKRRKIDFSTFDWSKFSGDERVPVINQSSGQKLTGTEAPKLKVLAQWLMEHPNYDVDPQWAEGKDRLINTSELQRRLGDEKKVTITRSGSSPSVSVSTTIIPTSVASSITSPLSSVPKNVIDPRNLLQGLDLKNPLTLAALSTLDPKVLSSFDPKLFAAMDPKAFFIDPNQVLDPKILSMMGFDPKLLGLDVTKLQPEHKQDKKSTLSLYKTPDPKPSTSHGLDQRYFALDPKVLQSLDPKLLGFDPKLLMGLDHSKLISGIDPKLLGFNPKALLGIDPKLLQFDPKLSMVDPKLLASLSPSLDPKALAAMDPKYLAAMGMDPMMLMAASGFGSIPGLPGLGLANPLLAGLPGFNIPGMPNLAHPKSKDNQRNAAVAAAAAAALAVSQANMFSGMFGGAAGLMYPPLGLGGLGTFPLSQMSVAQSSAAALLNGLSPTITSVAGSSKVQTSSSQQNILKAELRHESDSRKLDERESLARRERHREALKGGLSKEERSLLKQKKAERLARGEPFLSPNEALLANHFNQLSQLGQIDFSVRTNPKDTKKGGDKSKVSGKSGKDGNRVEDEKM